jgi:hypothetical protein
VKQRQRRLKRIRAVETEYRVVTQAVAVLDQESRRRPELLRGEGLRASDVAAAADRLEERYLTALFAEFEAGLRDVWKNALSQTTEPRVRDLIDALAARRKVPLDVQQEVHDVREYRNEMVHEGGDEAESIALREAAASLCRFFSRMPLDW